MSGTALTRKFGVTKYDKKKALNGYTLLAPLWNKFAWLIDMEGNIVHKWTFNKRPGDFTELLPNGNLLYPERFPTPKVMFLGGCGCDLLEVNWDNKVVWKHIDGEQHHIVRRLRNGNTVYPVVKEIPHNLNSKVKGGIPGSEENGQSIFGDNLREVNPDGEIVWEWVGHERLDLDVFSICPMEPRADWVHTNSIVEMPDGDLLICCRNIDSLIIIDKKTGDVKWHWGKGHIKHAHMVSYVGDGNVMCYDNGPHRENILVDYSRVVIVNIETKKIVWEYVDEAPQNHFSLINCGAQKLPNGNIFITESTKGRIIEVTPEKEIVWEYYNPFYNTTGLETQPGWNSWVHRAYRYPVDYSGFEGKEFNPVDYREYNKIYGSGAF